jgi:alkylation response protein AidB-like acyl-CoA dehydrogenase
MASYPFTDDHDMIREAACGFLQEWYDGGKGPERVYQLGKAFDVDAWQSFAQELGMAGIAIDEDYDGAALGDLGRVVVMEELGASLCAIPFLTTCGIVADLISAVGTEDTKKTFLPKIASGDMKAAYCDGHDAKAKRVFNTVYGDCADVIFLSRCKNDGIEIISIPVGAKGLTITPEKTMDPTRSFSAMDWSSVAENDITIVGTTTQDQLNEIVTQSFIALAAECVGGAQKCLDMTLEYAGQRVQFGRPIASFQAIKHRCADMFILIEAARSAVYAAAIAPPEEKTQAALIAKAYATEAFFKVAGDAIQLHGGIGFTWEYPLHFFFKRARANKSMFGGSARDYDRLADHIFGGAA